MRIAVESTTLLMNQAGVSSYLKGLLEGFAQMPDITVDLLSVGKHKNQQSGFKKKLTTAYRELAWQPYILPQKAKRLGSDLLFAPGHLVATKAPIPRFVTFHDFYILRSPKSFTRWHSLFCNWQFPRIFASAPHVIVISEFTKQELYHFFPNFKGTVEVIHNGISADWQSIKEQAVLQLTIKKFNLPSTFLFAVGSLEPRKNFVTLLRTIDQATLGKFPPLVLTIPDSWNMSTDASLIQKLVAQKKLIILQNIDRADLVALYNLASCMVYPSLYEGFGIPPMEAMACGCPVVTSANSALEELYHDAALLIENPTNTEELSAAIYRVLTDENLRTNLIQKGFALSSRFHFKMMAEKTKNYFATHVR